MKLLEDIIPENSRKIVYAVFALIGLILGAAQVAVAAADQAQPVWLTSALAVYTFLGGATGLLAQSNTDNDPFADVPSPRTGDADGFPED